MQTYRFVAFFFAAYVVHVRVHPSVKALEMHSVCDAAREYARQELDSHA
jgi:hypothetical protein